MKGKRELRDLTEVNQQRHNKYQISLNDLTSISKKLVNSFFPSNDIYSLLLLALVTVTKYFRGKKNISMETHIEIVIAYAPHLIEYLVKEDIITPEVCTVFNKNLEEGREELPLILQSYVYAAKGVRIKTELKDGSEKDHCGIM